MQSWPYGVRLKKFLVSYDMALTEEQRKRLISEVDKLPSIEIDRVLQSIDNFTHFLYNVCRDIYDAVRYAINRVWDWIKSIFD